MKPTKETLQAIKNIEKKVSKVCDTNDAVVDEITGIVYPKTKIKESTLKEVNEKNVTLKEFVALCMADIDIFLLKDESQENDNDKLYTKEEIRNQLKLTMVKMLSLPFVFEGCYDVDLFLALGHQVLLNSGFSEKNIKLFKS